MKALEAGGLEAVYREERDELVKKFGDEEYSPNSGGLYELSREDYKSPDFPRQFEGKLMKALDVAVPRMRVMPDLKVVFMMRDKEEIRQSLYAFFGREIMHPHFETRFEDHMKDVIEQINNRKDVSSLQVFWYRDVVENPKKHFQLLKDNGWPIDVDKCSAIVDPEQLRFRKERLSIGV